MPQIVYLFYSCSIQRSKKIFVRDWASTVFALTTNTHTPTQVIHPQMDALGKVSIPSKKHLKKQVSYESLTVIWGSLPKRQAITFPRP
nr:hypothetical protein [uncultured Desulfobulbus sp.]